MGDTGWIRGSDFEMQVEDTVRAGGAVLHCGRLVLGESEAVQGSRVAAHVDLERRRSTASNHTATHLLHAALRSVLGQHVHQAGSLVAPDRLRFDYTHFTPSEQEQLERIEEIVNEKVREDLPITTEYLGLEEARAKGAMALFGEKYGDIVRVVRIGEWSQELCGGTHLRSTGQIGTFRIVSEGGVAAGVRRAEAVTGLGAHLAMRSDRALLNRLGRLLGASPGDLPARVERLLAQNRGLEQEIASFRKRVAGSEIDQIADQAQTVNGFRVVSARVAPQDLDDFRRLADGLREKLGSGVGVLGAAINDRATFVAVVTDDLIRSRGLKAGDIVREVAKAAGGGGGGKPHLAQAGAKDVGKIDEALARTVEIVREQARA